MLFIAPECVAVPPNNSIAIVCDLRLGDALQGLFTIDANGAGISQDGTKENAVCSNRGICNELTGTCKCFLQYGSSDGWNGFGPRGDCGHLTPFADVPPVTLADTVEWRRQTGNQGTAAQYLRDSTNQWERSRYVSGLTAPVGFAVFGERECRVFRLWRALHAGSGSL